MLVILAFIKVIVAGVLQLQCVSKKQAVVKFTRSN